MVRRLHGNGYLFLSFQALYAPATPKPKNTQPNASVNHGLTSTPALRPNETVVPFFSAIKDGTMWTNPITIITKEKQPVLKLLC
jgi:hypothetical protein